MDENGIHLQIDIPGADLLSLKQDNGFIQIEKEKVQSIDDNVFLSGFKDFGQLTFLHPGDYDAFDTPDPLNDKNPDSLTDGSISSTSRELSRFSDFPEVFIHDVPLESATTAFEDTSVLPSSAGSVLFNATTSFFQENGLNFSSSLSNSSFAEWSSSGWSAEEIGAVFVVCLMVPFIICSNLFVIVSVIKFRRLHTPTNYFITSLASVDIVVAMATPLAIAVQLFQYGGGDAAHDTVLCLLPNRILMMACGVSLLTLATIAYDRHTALISPLEYVNIMTSRKVGIMMTVSWLYSSAVVWFPIAAGWYDVMSPTGRCSADHLHPKVHILFFVGVFVPSCTVIIICYSRIFLVARHHAKAIAAVEFAVHRRLQVRFMIKDTKYAKTLALVIGGFLLLWLPHLIYTFIKAFSEISISIWLETYLILLAVLNSGINPWIYAFKNNEFRAAFKRMAKEYCSDAFCKFDYRRSSLVSGMSITPRLSRTDSRMVSTILEPTTDYQANEKIRRSLDSLDDIDEYEIEEKSTCQLEEPEIDAQNSTEKLDSLPTLFPLKLDAAQIDYSEGHVNWVHIENELKNSSNEVPIINPFQKISGSTVARNQSFTLGFNNACSGRQFQTQCNGQSCRDNCKRSTPFSVPRLARSSSSVTPSSSFIPFPINRGVSGSVTSSSMNIVSISGLSSPPSSPSCSPSIPNLPYQLSPFSPQPSSSSPSSQYIVSSNRIQNSNELFSQTTHTRPRPTRNMCNQMQDSLVSECVATAGYPILNGLSCGRPRVSKLLHHSLHATESNNIMNNNNNTLYPCLERSNSSCTCPASPCITQVQSCPSFAQTGPAMANIPPPAADRPRDIVCSPVLGQPSAPDFMGPSS